MAIILPGRRHSFRPPTEARVDRAHPLADGLVFLAYPGADNRFAVVGAGDPAVAGTGANWTGHHTEGATLLSNSTDSPAAGAAYPRPPLVNTMVRDWTALVRMDPASYSAPTIIGAPYRDTVWDDPWTSWSMYANGTVLGYNHATGVGGWLYIDSDTGAIQTSDGLTWYGVRRIGASVRFYRNGRPHGADKSGAGTGTIDHGTRQPLTLMRPSFTQSVSGEGMNGRMDVAAVWNRPLSDAEVQWFCAEPYDVVAPPALRNRLWIVTVGAVSGTTLAVENAGALVTAGLAPTAKATATAPLGAVATAGLVPALGRTTAPLGAVATAGLAPTAKATATAPLGAIVTAGLVPALGRTSAPLGAVTTAGLAPTASAAATAPVGGVVLDGFAPSIAGGGTSLTVENVGALLTAGNAPAATATATTPLGAITTAGLVPAGIKTFADGEFIFVAPRTPTAKATATTPLGTIATAGLVPAAGRTTGPLGAIATAPQTPTAKATATMPAAGALLLSGINPTTPGQAARGYVVFVGD